MGIDGQTNSDGVRMNKLSLPTLDYMVFAVYKLFICLQRTEKKYISALTLKQNTHLSLDIRW